MKRIFIAATALFLAIGSLQAQTVKEEATEAHHKGIDGKNKFAHITLSDEQKKKVKEVRETYQAQFAELRKNTGMSVADYRAKMEALKKEQHEKMQALFTPEQKAQLAAQKKSGQERIKDGQANHLDKMKSALGLSEAQTQKLTENQVAFQDKMKSIRENQALSEDQKKAQVKVIYRQQHEQMKAVLTPEQLQKMKSGRKNRATTSEK